MRRTMVRALYVWSVEHQDLDPERLRAMNPSTVGVADDSGALASADSPTTTPANEAQSPFRTLLLTGPGKPPDYDMWRLIADDAMPDCVAWEDAIGATIVDDRYFAGLPGVRGRILRTLPLLVAQVLEVLRCGRDYDVVLSWSDARAILVGAVMRFSPNRPGQVAILNWPSKRKKSLPLRFAHQGIDRFLMWAPLQRLFAEEELGIPAERFVPIRKAVDTRFWRPMPGAGDLICSVGQEMRDYQALVEALGGLDIPCHIAAGTGIFNTTPRRWRVGWEQLVRPAGLTVGRKTFVELRELYARSRFVVIPLIPADNDNGITAILEAFAMGKAVICTESPGQVGILEHGVNCLRVPPGDPEALRAAIQELWSDPEKCRRLGAAGRERVFHRHAPEHWNRSVMAALSEAAAAGRARREDRVSLSRRLRRSMFGQC